MKYGSVKDTRTGEMVIFENVSELKKFKNPIFSMCNCGKPKIPHGHIHEKEDVEKKGQKVIVIEKKRGVILPDCLLRLRVVNAEQAEKLKSLINESGLKKELSFGDMVSMMSQLAQVKNGPVN